MIFKLHVSKVFVKKKKLYWAQEYSPALKEFNIMAETNI